MSVLDDLVDDLVDEPGPGAASSLPVRIARQVLQRLVQLVVVVFVLVVGTALLVRAIPGDPATAILGLNATPESLASLREELGLTRPIHVQVLDQVAALLRGDLGTSTAQPATVMQILGDALPVTLTLIGLSTLMAVLISLPVGLLPAMGLPPGGVRVLRLLMVTLIAVPSFLIALYLLLVFGVQVKLAPAGGWAGRWPENLSYAWLPSLALALFLAPVLVRTIERTTSQLMGEEFVEAAVSRGTRRSTLVVRHVLPNVLLPLITLVGFSVSVLLGGAVIIEAIYGIPGFGSVITGAVAQRDYPVIVGTTIFSGVFVVSVNLVTDLLYTLADPRTRS